MRRFKGQTPKILAAALAVALTLGAAGCGKGDSADTSSTVSGDEAGYAMAYGTGLAEDGSLNRDVYYRNADMFASGADPGIMYVSKEDDPEYGGYYYMYTSDELRNPGGKYPARVVLSHKCFRSPDLVSWETVGACDGYALISAADDWTLINFWAPECYRHPENGKYYMYYSAQRGYGGGRGVDPDNNDNGRTYVAIAESDTPVGPFHLVRSGRDADGNAITNAPIVDVQKHFNLPYQFAVIDANIFRDEDGSLYLTFAKHPDNSGFGRGIWGIKMKDPVTPDYSTLTCLTMNAAKTVKDYPVGTATKPVGEGAFKAEGLNEGGYLFRKGDKYYLTYSQGTGYGDRDYSVFQAVSDNPLGPFVKPDMGKGNPLISTTATSMSYMSGSGHHSMLYVDGEIFAVYAYHGNPDGMGLSSVARVIGIDRVTSAEIDGETYLVCNGPTISPQYLPEAISGYRNYAADAKVTVSGGEGKEYLNDGLLSVSASVSDREFVGHGKVTVTLTFPRPVKVSSIMVYNSCVYENAFRRVDEIRFNLAQPKLIDGKKYQFAAIRNLPFPEEYVDSDEGAMVQGAAALADFTEIEVKSISVTVSKKYVTKDVDGTALRDIGISEIAVLGKAA